MKKITGMLLGIGLIISSVQSLFAAQESIKIGFNIPLSGEFKTVGNSAKNIGEMIKEQIMSAGGLQVGNKTYGVEFVYANNTSTASGASKQVLSLASQDKVLGIIGPLSSRQAVPAGEVANAFGVPLISPWSTSPSLTEDRPFVFRSGYLVGVQAPVLTKFVSKEFGAAKAAILYDIVNTYPRFMAKDFKAVFEEVNGEGSIVAFEEFRTGDTDFTQQLKRIVQSNADILFTPQHYNEVPAIVRQARKLGWTKPIVGSNSWAGGDIVNECGEDCNGLYFVGNFAAGGVTGISKKFVDAYMQRYDMYPDEVAGLTMDALGVMIEAVKNTGHLTGNLVQDRANIQKELIAIDNYPGVSGTMSFNASGNPNKCAVMIRISDDGVLTHHESVCPEDA